MSTQVSPARRTPHTAATADDRSGRAPASRVLRAAWAGRRGRAPRAAAAGAALTVAVALPGAPWIPIVVVLAGAVLSRHRVRYGLHLRLLWRRAARESGLQAAISRRPRVVSTRPVPVGDELTLRLPPGVSSAALATFTPRLAHVFEVRDVRVDPVPEHTGHVRMTLIRHDPLNDLAAPLWPLQTAEGVSLQSSLPFAVDRDGLPVKLDVRRSLLLEGDSDETFGALSLVLAAAAMDQHVELRLLDGEQSALAGWHGLAKRFVGADPEVALQVLHELRDELAARTQEALRDSIHRLDPEAGYPLIVVVVHELQVYLDGSAAAELTAILVELVRRGGRLGIAVVVTGTEVPSALRRAIPLQWSLGSGRTSHLLRRAVGAIDVRRYDLSEPALVALLQEARVIRAAWSDLRPPAHLPRDTLRSARPPR